MALLNMFNSKAAVHRSLTLAPKSESTPGTKQPSAHAYAVQPSQKVLANSTTQCSDCAQQQGRAGQLRHGSTGGMVPGQSRQSSHGALGLGRAAPGVTDPACQGAHCPQVGPCQSPPACWGSYPWSALGSTPWVGDSCTGVLGHPLHEYASFAVRRAACM